MLEEREKITRVTFNEITKKAVQKAIKEPRDIDINLVDAQQARRVLDRIVGYKMSPVLWKKVKRGLSAGRVQSVAVKLIVDREEEIENFKPEERGKAMAVFGLVIVIAPIIGPVIGGWITENWSWPYIYFINLPIGLLALGLSKAFIYDPPYAQKQKGVKTDFLGFFLLTVFS